MAKRIKAPTSRGRNPDADFLAEVRKLARDGLNQQQIAEKLGIKSTTTLTARLVRASQTSRKPVPVFGGQRGRRVSAKRVETVKINRRGKGDAFGVNVPMEPLARAGFKVGTKLSVKATRGKIVLRGMGRTTLGRSTGRRRPSMVLPESVPSSWQPVSPPAVPERFG